MTNSLRYAQFAPVLPLTVAEALLEIDAYADTNSFGNYHLLLAHEVVKERSRNNKVYSDCFTIMDNSVIELGKPADPVMIEDAVNIVDANVLVLPDVLFDKSETILATTKALNGWASKFIGKVELMAVPQGKTIDEWTQCLERFSDIPEISWIGIPKNYRKVLGQSRTHALHHCHMLCPEKKVHLLGFSHDIEDDLCSASLADRYPNLKGIDSNVPVRLGLRDNILISLTCTKYSGRGDWMELSQNKHGDYWGQATANLSRVRKWIGMPEEYWRG